MFDIKDFDEFMNVFAKAFNEMKNEKESYVKTTYDKYQDGEHVSHSEKEYKDGKCVKDEGFDKQKELPKKECDRQKCVCDERKSTQKEVELQKRIDELIAEVKSLKDDNYKCKKELSEYKAKFETLKELFK